jgi:hypothetical protein
VEGQKSEIDALEKSLINRQLERDEVSGRVSSCSCDH